VSLQVEDVGAARIVTIDRPRAKNALDRATAQRLGDAIEAAARDASVRGIVLTAAGHDAFVSGGDLKEFRQLAREPGGAAEVLGMFEPLSACERVDVPVIAAVQGHAFGGGCELLLLADLVVIEQHARLSFRQAKMGLSPAWGGAARLMERAGPIETARLLLTGATVSADEATRLRLANEVVPPGDGRARAVALVEAIAEHPRAAIAELKRALRATRQAPREASQAAERAAFSALWGAPAHLAAMDAFLKR
jgi:enoyl-CoA hydratase